MATTQSSKTAANKANGNRSSGKAASKSSTTARRAASRNPSVSGTSASRRNRRNTNPYWATTVASLVGVGVAIGVGLFATRRQWMPYAEDMNEYLHDRWDQYAHSDDGDEDDHSDFHADEEDWSDTPDLAAATYPSDMPRPTIS